MRVQYQNYKLVAKLMRQNSKKMTVPCLPAIEVESYVPLVQDEVQHWVPGLTTEDKKMITSPYLVQPLETLVHVYEDALISVVSDQHLRSDH